MKPSEEDSPKDPFETRLDADQPLDSSPSLETQGPEIQRSSGNSDPEIPGSFKADSGASRAELADDQSVGQTRLESPSLDRRAENVPALVGPYFVIEPLGEGGMGQVFLAEQRVPVKRLVAIKLIKSGMDSREVLKRFDAERQALALMDHPSIAKILDAGDTSDGRPYFAMELVRGQPLTDYCDQHSLNLHQRLDLFVQVCDAVQHAHQKGVLHRDLKPSNILVTEVDGKPVPKVIDFGLAKALQAVPGLMDKGVTTRIGQVLGTLKYMSPEQADLDEVDIDTRTDIYALGVILYELLTGTTPLDEASLRGRALAKLLEMVRTNEPEKPSSRLLSGSQGKQKNGKPNRPGSSNNSGSSNNLTDARSTDVKRFIQVLAGDLDWITMKAIENDRKRRYQTASGFAEDVRRFLTGRPVLARPPSFLYWMNKSVRRHKFAAASMLMIVFCLGAAILGLLYGMNRANRLARFERQARLLSESQRKFEQIYLPRKYSIRSFDYDDIFELKPLIEQISNVNQAAAQAANADVVQTYALAIKSRIEDDRATQADLKAADADIQKFDQLIANIPGKAFQEIKEDLETALRRRMSDWQTVVDMPMVPIAESFTIQDSLGDLTATRLGLNLSTESLQKLTFLELSLLEQESAGYLFRITTTDASGNGPPDSAKSFAEVMASGSKLTLSVSRGSETLATQQYKMPLTGQWRVMTEVDSGRLTFEVNEQSLSLRDIFAVNSKGTSVGLRGSGQFDIEAVKFEVKQRPQFADAIETADFHFVASEILSAANIYSKLDSWEARFKLGLCRFEQRDSANARQIFADIFREPRPSSDQQVIWHLLSGMWLYILNLETRDYDGKQEVLNRLVSSYPGRLSQYLPFVPLRLQQRLLADLRKDGPRWTIALQTDSDVLQLRFAVNMDSSNINIAPRRVRGTRWRLADALRSAQRWAEAEEILLNLLQDAQTASDATPVEISSLVSDVVWLYIRQSKVDEAARLIESRADLGLVDLPVEQAPLLTEQARIDLAEGDISSARARLNRFFELVQPVIDDLRRDLSTQKTAPISHAAFSDACLLAGLIASDSNDMPTANSYWEKGLRKNWPTWSTEREDAFGFGHQLVNFQASLTNEAILHSLTGGSRPEDLEEGLRAELGGKRGGRDDIFLLTQVLGYATFMISPVVERMFDVPEVGDRWRREMILKTAPFKDYFTRPIPLLIYRFVRVVFIPGADLTAAIEQEGFAVCKALVAMHDRGELNVEEDFSIIVNFIKDPLSQNGLDSVRQRYPPEIAGALGYLAFKRESLSGEIDSERGKRFLSKLADFENMPPAMAADIKSYRDGI